MDILAYLVRQEWAGADGATVTICEPCQPCFSREITDIKTNIHAVHPTVSPLTCKPVINIDFQLIPALLQPNLTEYFSQLIYVASPLAVFFLIGHSVVLEHVLCLFANIVYHAMKTSSTLCLVSILWRINSYMKSVRLPGIIQGSNHVIEINTGIQISKTCNTYLSSLS